MRNRVQFERRADIDELYARTRPSPSSLSGQWILVTHAMSPYPAQAGERKFLVDSTAGPVTIRLNAATFEDEVVFEVKDWKGESPVNPITVLPPGSITIEDPNNPGTQVTAGAGGARITTQGQSPWWQYISSLGQLILTPF